MASKPTTIQDDVIALKELNSDISKGFSSNKGSKKNNNEDIIDPSGSFKDSKVAAITFCIEKKKLLVEAAKH